MRERGAAMPGRTTILICHSPADKKWAERMQIALGSGKTTDVLLWDGTNSRAKADAPRTLVAALAAATHAVILVSARFLHTPAFFKARRPLQHAAEQGTREAEVILAGHCVWEATWLRDFPVVAGMDCPLDSLNASRRVSVMNGIASELLQRLSPAGVIEETQNDKVETDEGEILPTRSVDALSPYARRLGALIAFQKEVANTLRRWNRMLLIVALGAVAAAAAVSFAGQSEVLFFLIAGFGTFAASLAFVVWARCRLTEQRVMSAQYIRTGFIDPTVPSRQRAALTKKADAMLAQF